MKRQASGWKRCMGLLVVLALWWANPAMAETSELVLSGDLLSSDMVDAFGFNTTAAQALGIERPKTYLELMDIYSRWDEQYADAAEQLGYCLSNMPLDGVIERFVSWEIDAYIAQWGDPEARPLDFETAEFRTYLTQLDACREGLSRLAQSVAGHTTNAENVLFFEQYPMLVTLDNAECAAPGMEPFAMSLTDAAAAPVIPVQLYVFTVNQVAAHPDQAMRCLTDVVQHYTADQRIYFSGAALQPVEDAAYAENVAYYTAELQAMDERILLCSDSAEIVSLREQRAQLQAEMDALEETRWYITGSSLAHF